MAKFGNCEVCTFWIAQKGADREAMEPAPEFGTCARYPPTPLLMPENVKVLQQLAYTVTQGVLKLVRPRMNGKDGCGEFDKRAGVVPDRKYAN